MAQYIPAINRQPHLFLSHSSKDKDFVRKLANDLAVCEVDVWLDEWEIEPGDSIYKSINSGLKSSRYIALIISGAFLESKWASEEVESAFSRQVEDQTKVIIPILLENVEIPDLLRGKLYISFLDDYYSSLTKLAGLIHGITLRTLSHAILTKQPRSLHEVIDVLAYCGRDPYMIIPKDVFDELATLPFVELDENRLHFHDVFKVISNESVSEKAKYYLGRVWTGVGRDPRRQVN